MTDAVSTATESAKELVGNEKLNALLIDMVEKTTAGMSNAVDWTMEQIPDLIHQLLLWNLVTNVMTALMTLVLLVAMAVAYVKFWKWGAQPDEKSYNNQTMDGDGFGRVIAGMFGGFIFMIVFTLGFYPAVLEAVKIVVAPKLWLLEYAINLVK